MMAFGRSLDGGWRSCPPAQPADADMISDAGKGGRTRRVRRGPYSLQVVEVTNMVAVTIGGR
jgi:hypothetical protein